MVVVRKVLTIAVTGVRTEYVPLPPDARAGGAGTVSAGDTWQQRLVAIAAKVDCRETIPISAVCN